MWTKLFVIVTTILLTPYVLADRCIDSIRSQANSAQQTPSQQYPIKVDVADYIDIYNPTLSPAHVLAEIEGIPVFCNVSELYPRTISQPNPLLKTDDRQVIPVKAGILDNIGWILYLSAFSDGDYDEAANGLALSIVTFDSDGKIIDTLPLSAFSQYEGMIEKSSSVISNKTITFCLQEVEFFAYDDNGDVDHELDKPKISSCQIEHYLVDKGIFKPVTREW